MAPPPPLKATGYPRVWNNFLVHCIRLPDFPSKLRILRFFRAMIGAKRLVASTVHGFQMMLDDADLIQRCILNTGDWEPKISAILATELKIDDVFYDIGSNVGFDTCLALSRGVAKVVAFDPDTFNATMLNANVALNGFAVNKLLFVPKAVGNKPGTQGFQAASSANTGIGSLSRDNRGDLPQVGVTTIDEMVANEGASAPTVMKIDVEGWEYEVLSGSKNTLAAHKPRIVLFEADCAPNGAIADERLQVLLTDLGYKIECVGVVDSKADYIARSST